MACSHKQNDSICRSLRALTDIILRHNQSNQINYPSIRVVTLEAESGWMASIFASGRQLKIPRAPRFDTSAPAPFLMNAHEFLCLKGQRARRGKGVVKFRNSAVAALLATLGLYLPLRDASAAPSEIERVGALINVSNLDVSLDFFTRLVGLKEAGRVPIGPGAWEVLLSPSGTDVEGQVALVYTPDAIKTVDQGNGFNRLVLFTKTASQVDEIAGKIAAAGYATVIPPSTAEIPGGRRYRYTHMKGPDGYTVELTWFDPAVRVSKP